MTVNVVINPLPPARSDEEFQIHCDALEWSLAEPIIIHSADDIKSKADWQDLVSPYHHQVQNLMRFCRRLPVTLLADDVGLGKTISAGLIISELMKRSRVHKVLVVCPKILIPQWIEELEGKFRISGYGATGSELRASHRRTESVIVTTYQSATNFISNHEAGLFDMLILDEAHKIRNLHGSKSPPKMATAIYDALESRRFKYTLMLTATPIQNRLWDIYSLVDCLSVARGHKNPFGSSERFAARYLADGKNSARKLKQENGDEFRAIVGEYMFRTRRVDAKLIFPDRKVQMYAVTPDSQEQQLQQLVGEHIGQFSPLLQTSLLVALMSSPRALESQLQNMADKNTSYQRFADVVTSVVGLIKIPAKTSAVLQIAKDLRQQRTDWRMVIFTTRRETQRTIADALDDAGISYGFISGGAAQQNRKTIERFRKKTPEIHVVISTDAGAEGVNLQAANILVNYDLPWNPMVVEQRIGRVQRIGSKFKNVWVANIVHDRSPEQRIVGRLMEKLQVISHTVGDIEAVLDAGDSNGDSFEKNIRDMVVSSLQGQDTEAVAQAAEASITEAKALFESQRGEIDRTLGGMADEEESAVLPMPRLSVAQPRTNPKDFVLSALQQEGSQIQGPTDGVYRMSSNGFQEESFTFDIRVWDELSKPGVFMGRSPQLYQPGKPAFERLVQRWLDRSGSRLTDEHIDNTQCHEIGRAWVHDMEGAEFIRVTRSNETSEFSGTVLCRTRVSNAVDSYEKIIKIPCKSNVALPTNELHLGDRVDASQLVQDLKVHITKAIQADVDIEQFRKFYESRLENELNKTAPGPHRDKLVNDLKPNIAAEASAITGSLDGESELIVSYRFDPSSEYESRIVWRAGSLAVEPDFATCALTSAELPVDCLGVCSVTGARALRHKLEASEVSGSLAMPDQLETCQASGAKALKTELDTCSLTGQRVRRDMLAESAASGKLALATKIVKCGFTGADILPSESVESDISGKKCRRDEAVHLEDNRLAHRSEASRCGFTRAWHLRSECAMSDATGKTSRIKDLRKSDVSDRRCHFSEVAECEVSGKCVLPDELAKCAVTGKKVCKHLLVACAETKQKALKDALVPCEHTGDLVLPHVRQKCCLTGKNLKLSLLGQSSVSGKFAARNLLLTCQESGAALLPDEAATCFATGKVVERRRLKQCSVSQKWALPNAMVQSQASSNWLLREHAVPLHDGSFAGKNEVGWCNWSEEYDLESRIEVCSICGLGFSLNLLNDEDEFVLLRQCLDGKHDSAPVLSQEARCLPQVPSSFKGLFGLKYVSNPKGTTHIFFGKKAAFGIMKRWVAVLATGTFPVFNLQGMVVTGKRTKSGWMIIEEEEI